MIHRRHFIIAGAAFAALPLSAAAHHGWSWTSDEDFVLTGVIREARLGNPHGLLDVEDAQGALWIADLGQPWRHAGAGVPDAELVAGAEITLEGHRSSDPDELRMKAERIVFAGMRYDLYPDRS